MFRKLVPSKPDDVDHSKGYGGWKNDGGPGTGDGERVEEWKAEALEPFASLKAGCLKVEECWSGGWRDRRLGRGIQGDLTSL